MASLRRTRDTEQPTLAIAGERHRMDVEHGRSKREVAMVKDKQL